MSVLAQTYFCGNGHIVMQIEHGWLPDRLPDNCQFCSNPDLYMCLEWGNKEYLCGSDVPEKPIRRDEKGILIYDISKLHKLDKKGFFEVI